MHTSKPTSKVLMTLLLILPTVVSAHSEQQQRVGPTVWKGVFFGSLILLGVLLLFRGVDTLLKDGLIKTILFGLIGCSAVLVCSYLGYHYFFH